MKKLIVLAIPFLFLLMFSSATASAQAAISATAQPLSFPDHPQHAEPHDLATERPIVGGGPNTYTYAQGERPLWEFPNPEQALRLATSPAPSARKS